MPGWLEDGRQGTWGHCTARWARVWGRRLKAVSTAACPHVRVAGRDRGHSTRHNGWCVLSSVTGHRACQSDPCTQSCRRIDRTAAQIDREVCHAGERGHSRGMRGGRGHGRAIWSGGARPPHPPFRSRSPFPPRPQTPWFSFPSPSSPPCPPLRPRPPLPVLVLPPILPSLPHEHTVLSPLPRSPLPVLVPRLCPSSCPSPSLPLSLVWPLAVTSPFSSFSPPFPFSPPFRPPFRPPSSSPSPFAPRLLRPRSLLPSRPLPFCFSLAVLASLPVLPSSRFLAHALTPRGFPQTYAALSFPPRAPVRPRSPVLGLLLFRSPIRPVFPSLPALLVFSSLAQHTHAVPHGV